MFSRINSLGLLGMESYTVCVEVDISGGLPRMDVVGLPDTAVSEARNRVRSAVKNSGFEFPASRVTNQGRFSHEDPEGYRLLLHALQGVLGRR